MWCAEIFEIVSELSVFPVMLDALEKINFNFIYKNNYICFFREERRFFFFRTEKCKRVNIDINNIYINNKLLTDYIFDVE